MIVSLIAAVSENGVIGKKGKIPWKLPADLRLFKQLTMGHHLIVGRKTWESIGKALPGREMIVLSRKADYKAEGCRVAGTLSQALEMARAAGEEEAFIGGGAAVYAKALPLADRFYLSRVHTNTRGGDAFFPAYEEKEWLVSLEVSYQAEKRGKTGFTFYILERKKRLV